MYDSNSINSNDLNRSILTKKSETKKKTFLFLIFRCCFKRDKDKLIAMNPYFDKAFDLRNYFKRLIDIEKIKTILSSKNDKDKEFILKKFNPHELEQMNFNIYDQELLFKFYQRISIAGPTEFIQTLDSNS